MQQRRDSYFFCTFRLFIEPLPPRFAARSVNIAYAARIYVCFAPCALRRDHFPSGKVVIGARFHRSRDFIAAIISQPVGAGRRADETARNARARGSPRLLFHRIRTEQMNWQTQIGVNSTGCIRMDVIMFSFSRKLTSYSRLYIHLERCELSDYCAFRSLRFRLPAAAAAAAAAGAAQRSGCQ